MTLKLKAMKIEFVYDELDSNAITFVLDNKGYFSIQTCVYLEEDEQLNDPVFEFNDQGDSQNGGAAAVTFGNQRILLTFKDSELFLKKYKIVEISLNQPPDKKVVDFFANHLFLGELLSYDSDFDQSNKVVQTAHREPI